MDAIIERIRNSNGFVKNIGEVRKEVLLSYVQKAGQDEFELTIVFICRYDDSIAKELFLVWRDERRKVFIIMIAL